jgi:uncharacterized protein (TIGR02265 family)
MKVKGNIIRSRIGFVKERFGDEAWQRVLAALPESDRQQLASLAMSVAWYDFELGDRLDKAIVAVVGGGNTRIFEEMGRASARENLNGVHSSFLEPRDPQKFMAKAPLIYRFYYDTGQRAWAPDGPTSGVLTTTGSQTFSTADCATVIGWYAEALGMVGARDVTIVEETCCAQGADACRYRVSWS